MLSREAVDNETEELRGMLTPLTPEAVEDITPDAVRILVARYVDVLQNYLDMIQQYTRLVFDADRPPSPDQRDNLKFLVIRSSIYREKLQQLLVQTC